MAVRASRVPLWCSSARVTDETACHLIPGGRTAHTATALAAEENRPRKSRRSTSSPSSKMPPSIVTDAGACRKGGMRELLRRGLEQKAEDLRVGRSRRRDAPLPPAHQVTGDAELFLADLDADADQPSGHVLLGPSPKPPLSPQSLVLHNPHSQDWKLLAILPTGSDGLK